MFATSEIETELNAEIESLLNKLKSHESTSEEYATIIKRLSELHKLKSEEAQITLRYIETEHKITPDRIKPPSMDTVLVVAANIFGIYWLTRYEKENVISSKALGFVFKPR